MPVFCNPLQSYDIDSEKDNNQTIADIDFDENDFIDAIASVSANAASGPDSFSAMFLKKCGNILATSLWL